MSDQKVSATVATHEARSVVTLNIVGFSNETHWLTLTIILIDSATERYHFRALGTSKSGNIFPKKHGWCYWRDVVAILPHRFPSLLVGGSSLSFSREVAADPQVLTGMVGACTMYYICKDAIASELKSLGSRQLSTSQSVILLCRLSCLED